MNIAKKLSIMFYKWAWKIKPIEKENKNLEQGETKNNGKN